MAIDYSVYCSRHRYKLRPGYGRQDIARAQAMYKSTYTHTHWHDPYKNFTYLFLGTQQLIDGTGRRHESFKCIYVYNLYRRRFTAGIRERRAAQEG